MKMKQDAVTLMGVGDVFVSRQKPKSIFAQVKPQFRQADILFGNCEGPYSDKGTRNPAARGIPEASPSNMMALEYAGFNVMNFANNHHLDRGTDAFFFTIDALRKMGIATVGVGRDIMEARKPTICELKKTKIAFLGYCSILPPGYDAGVGKPGCAPMTALTYYQQIEHEQPGTEPLIYSFPDPGDLDAMKEDLKMARQLADVVVVSFHWGLHFVPAKLALYEKQVARTAIDEGADLVLGHHQHILKPIDVYKGKVIFYGLGIFACDFGDLVRTQGPTSPSLRFLLERYRGQFGFWPDYPNYPFSPEARNTMIAKCLISNKKIQKVSYLPCMVDAQNAPVPLTHDDKRFIQAKKYMEKICKNQGINVKFTVEGDEIVIPI